MGWGSNWDFISIVSYEQAQIRYDNTVPIRSKNYPENERPLGKRYDRCRWIIKEGEVYHLRLYRTKCVSYYPDGKIVINTGGWSTHSTCIFISRASPLKLYNCFMFDNKAWIHWGDKRYVIPETGLTLKGDKVYGAKQQYKHVLNKEKCKKVRTSFKQFVYYCDTMLKLGLEKGWNWNAREDLLKFDLKDESTYHLLYKYIQGDTISNIRKNLWKWAYKEYKCWKRIKVPMGEMEREYPK